MDMFKVISIICVICFFVEAKSYHHQKREAIPNICSQNNNINKLQCFCIEDTQEMGTIRAADCYLATDISASDPSWNALDNLKNITKLNLSNSRGITLKYIPTHALKHFTHLERIDVKHGNIQKILAFAFNNYSKVKEINLRGNKIESLEVNAFANHEALTTLSLDNNYLLEINRNVFVNLPFLEKLYLTDNKITTIHDKAFVHLRNLKELEIDRNVIFSLNSESFAGLENLERLELSSNSLEVIGDNTFQPLTNLRALNLDSNKIQMLDEKAFNGLSKIISISLSRNELKTIDNVNTFEGLNSLIILRLKGNKIVELKKEVLAPILNKLYGSTGSLDVDENNFPCDCRLEWFAELMNKTKNKRLRTEIENLKCYPDIKLKDTWQKLAESENSETQEIDEKDAKDQEFEYEFYDDTQLGGKLFYFDVRFLLNCSSKRNVFEGVEHPVTESKIDIPKTTGGIGTVTTFRAAINSPVSSTTKQMDLSQINYKQVTNHGLLDLSGFDDTTPQIQVTKVPYVSHEKVNTFFQNEINKEVKPNMYTTSLLASASEKVNPSMYTTSRLATVSENPNNRYEENEMASDEAKPDKLKAQRSVDNNLKSSVDYNSASRNIVHIFTFVTVFLCYSISY